METSHIYSSPTCREIWVGAVPTQNPMLTMVCSCCMWMHVVRALTFAQHGMVVTVDMVDFWRGPFVHSQERPQNSKLLFWSETKHLQERIIRSKRMQSTVFTSWLAFSVLRRLVCPNMEQFTVHATPVDVAIHARFWMAVVVGHPSMCGW